MAAQTVLRSSNLTEALIAQIRQMIVDGELVPGDWLPPQPELAQRFGVGLSTVREAVAGLSLLGILVPQPGRGTQVSLAALPLLRSLDMLQARLSELELVKVFEARQVLEVELSALAAERAMAEDKTRMAAALRRMGESLNDDESFCRADLEFHTAVAHAAQNPLMEQWFLLAGEILVSISRELLAVPGNREHGLRLQERILEAICAGDAEAARQWTRELLTRVSETA